MPCKTRNFKSKVAYMKWLAFGHMHGAFKVPGHQRVLIRGRLVRVKHK